MVALRLFALVLLTGSLALSARADLFPYEQIGIGGRNNAVDSNALSCDTALGCFTTTGARCSDNPDQLCNLQIVPAGRCTYGNLTSGPGPGGSSCVWPHWAGRCAGSADANKVGCLSNSQCTNAPGGSGICDLTTSVFGELASAYAGQCTCQGTNSGAAGFETAVCQGTLSICSDGDPTRAVGGLGVGLGAEINTGGAGAQTFANMGPSINGSSTPTSTPPYALENPPINFNPMRDAGSLQGTSQGSGVIRQVRITDAREIGPYTHPTIGTAVDVRKIKSYGDSYWGDTTYVSQAVSGSLNVHIVTYPCPVFIGYSPDVQVSTGKFCHQDARDGIGFVWGSDLTGPQVAAYTVGGKRVCPPNCNKDFDLSTMESEELAQVGTLDANAGIQLAIQSGEEAAGRQAGARDVVGVAVTTSLTYLNDTDIRCKLGGWGNAPGLIGRCSDGSRACTPGGVNECGNPPAQGTCMACNGPILGTNPLGLPIGYNTHGRSELDLLAGQRIGNLSGIGGDVRVPLFVVGTTGHAATDFRDIEGEGGTPGYQDLADLGPVDTTGPTPFAPGIGDGGTFAASEALNIAETIGLSPVSWDEEAGGDPLGSWSYAHASGTYISPWSLAYELGPGDDGIPGCIGNNNNQNNGAFACNNPLGKGGVGNTGMDDHAIMYTVGAATKPANAARFLYRDAHAGVVSYFGGGQNPPTMNTVAAFTARDLTLLQDRNTDILVKVNTTACPLTSYGPQCALDPEPCAGLGGDSDLDTVCNNNDNCPLVWQATQADGDGDTVGDACDNCPVNANTSQANADSDARGDICDNCPTVANNDQSDTDADSVGQACDNCLNVANARVAGWTFAAGGATYLGANQWATLTGGQRDDDHDGYGNICDGDFPGTTTAPAVPNVSAADVAQFKASNGKLKSADICGTNGLRPCAIYDLNATNSTEAVGNIGPADISRFKALNGLPFGPRCTTCPMACQAGTAGTCF